MPWWGWVILGIVVVVGFPIKMRVLKNMMKKREADQREDF